MVARGVVGAVAVLAGLTMAGAFAPRQTFVVRPKVILDILFLFFCHCSFFKIITPSLTQTLLVVLLPLPHHVNRRR
jgi:hypothetical protein